MDACPKPNRFPAIRSSLADTSILQQEASAVALAELVSNKHVVERPIAGFDHILVLPADAELGPQFCLACGGGWIPAKAMTTWGWEAGVCTASGEIRPLYRSDCYGLPAAPVKREP